MKKKPRNLIELNPKEETIRRLSLSPNLFMQLTRIGYDDEGLRLTIFDAIPFNVSMEIQFGRKDAQWLIANLEEELSDERNRNLPR